MKQLQKIIFLIFFVCLSFEYSFSQYGNEWIDYNQQYYSFPVFQTGLKRINYDDLQSAGIPVSTFSH